ncbi:hypothetical protein [Lactobacillus crispatus]|uniref:hypothetical protein n=1 Tax=Lactobacillus crispatus TaxID=47770 RepID=UPI0015DFE2F5|nr:hypothetical protein [Lactobacillus crispatus]QLK33401.1 hypothetical protein H0G71_04155 [Lactobacillus crispatus]
MFNFILDQIKNNPLGVLGSVTGIIGSAVSISNWYKAKPKIKVEISPDSSIPNAIVPGIYCDGNCKNPRVVLNLWIKNQSATEVTLGGIQLYYPPDKKWYSWHNGLVTNLAMIPVIDTKDNNKKITIDPECYPGLEFPYRLEAYGITYFQIGTDIKHLTSKNRVKVKFILPSSSQKKYSFQLKSFDEYLNHMGYKLSE